MLTYDKIEWKNEKKYVEGSCLAKDSKPTGGPLMNGSKLFEMDTSTFYMYDEENRTWRAW